MSNLKRFEEYAAAFEETYADDNWTRLEQYFTEDAVYLPGDGTEAVGRSKVLEALRNSVNGLDRNFDSRALGDGPTPTEDGNVVTLIWSLILKKEGVPDLVLSGRELLTYSGDAIQRMEDIFDEGVPDILTEWMQKHSSSLAG
jgi:hypothetical protein